MSSQQQQQYLLKYFIYLTNIIRVSILFVHRHNNTKYKYVYIQTE